MGGCAAKVPARSAGEARHPEAARTLASEEARRSETAQSPASDAPRARLGWYGEDWARSGEGKSSTEMVRAAGGMAVARFGGWMRWSKQRGNGDAASPLDCSYHLPSFQSEHHDHVTGLSPATST
uniref:Uncharacterized protein n=1 Tax=Setaria italica TaxID=4555 RepID=K4A405_SETIT